METREGDQPDNTYENIGVTASDYAMAVLQAGGSLLHSNRIGDLTLMTTFRGLGRFEHVAWVDKLFGQSVDGYVVAQSPSLELANGFHLALAAQLWNGPYGQGVKERAQYFSGDAELLLRQLCR